MSFTKFSKEKRSERKESGKTKYFEHISVVCDKGKCIKCVKINLQPTECKELDKSDKDFVATTL